MKSLEEIHPYISIHALLAESDRHHQRPPGSTGHFYPRSPCGERPFIQPLVCDFADFYPRSPCGERPISIQCITPSGQFLSTLSLRRATQGNTSKFFGVLFLSTLSLRRATGVSTMDNGVTQISIHALLAESDGTGR